MIGYVPALSLLMSQQSGAWHLIKVDRVLPLFQMTKHLKYGENTNQRMQKLFQPEMGTLFGKTSAHFPVTTHELFMTSHGAI